MWQCRDTMKCTRYSHNIDAFMFKIRPRQGATHIVNCWHGLRDRVWCGEVNWIKWCKHQLQGCSSMD